MPKLVYPNFKISSFYFTLHNVSKFHSTIVQNINISTMSQGTYRPLGYVEKILSLFNKTV